MLSLLPNHLPQLFASGHGEFASWHLAFFDVGFPELIVVGVAALLVFGGELPDVMRSVGRAYGKLRRSLTELSQPVRDEFRSVSRDMTPKDLTSRDLLSGKTDRSGHTPPPVRSGGPPTTPEPVTPDTSTSSGDDDASTPRYSMDDEPAKPPSKWADLLDEPPPV